MSDQVICDQAMCDRMIDW